MRAVSNRARPGTMLAVEFEELEGSTNGRSLATTGRPAALLRRTLDGSSWPTARIEHRARKRSHDVAGRPLSDEG